MTDHLLQYGDTAVRRAVPLALAMCHVSDPDYGIIDILSKLSHDSNEETVREGGGYALQPHACVHVCLPVLPPVRPRSPRSAVAGPVRHLRHGARGRRHQ